jgi:hypothetical protein
MLYIKTNIWLIYIVSLLFLINFEFKYELWIKICLSSVLEKDKKNLESTKMSL